MPPRPDIEAMHGPPYHIIYDISYGECATDKPFCERRPNIFETMPFLGRLWRPYIVFSFR